MPPDPQTQSIVRATPISKGRPPEHLVLARDERVLNTAAALFQRRGYHRVSIAAIAQAAEVAGRTIYARFGDKAGLLKALVERECATDLEFAIDLMRQMPHPQVMLLKIGRYWVERVFSLRRRLLRSDLLAERDFILADKLEASLRKPWLGLFQQLLDSGEFGIRVSQCVTAEQATTMYIHCVMAGRSTWQHEMAEPELNSTAAATLAKAAVQYFRATLAAIDAGAIDWTAARSSD